MEMYKIMNSWNDLRGACRCFPQMEMEEAEEEEEELHFSGQDLMKIRDAVVLLVQSLLRLLQTFTLKDRPQIASNCTQVTTNSTITLTSYYTKQVTCFFFLCRSSLSSFTLSPSLESWPLPLNSEFSDVLLCHVEKSIQDMKEKTVMLFLHREISKLRSVPEMAFYGLQLLCSPKHGDQREVRFNNHGPWGPTLCRLGLLCYLISLNTIFNLQRWETFSLHAPQWPESPCLLSLCSDT